MRSAYNFGADLIFTVGARYKKQITDTQKSFRHVPVLHFENWESYRSSAPYSWIPVAVEITQDAVDIRSFKHPRSCVYLLGPEDGSISKTAIEMSKYQVKIPTNYCLNVAIAGTVVMYDRISKAGLGKL